MTKTMTLRLPQDQADALALVAKVAGRPVSEEIREAIESHIRRRRDDPAFQVRLRAHQARLLKLSDKAVNEPTQRSVG